MKAKLQNNTLVYATNFEKIGKDWVSNPTNEMLASEGFKEVFYEEVDEVLQPYGETETNIIVYTQKYIPTENETQAV